jgi:acyl-homoserine lactone acylase PvdQ
VDPDRGWVANWNNKPARGWDSFDGFKWGAVQRVELLHDQMRTLLAGGGQAELSDLVDVIRTAATQDARGAYLGAQMTRWARRLLDSDRHDRAAAIVRRWVKLGAHRTNRDRDGDMDRGPALAIFDRWWKLLVHAIFDDELGRKGYRLMDAPVADYSPQSGSSFFFDFSSYLRTLFDRGKGSYARNYCDDLSTGDHESCRGLVASSLRRAVRELTQEQGRDMSAWEKPAENLQFQELGAGSVPEIPWQNRGTHNHVVEILEDLSP